MQAFLLGFAGQSDDVNCLDILAHDGKAGLHDQPGYRFGYEHVMMQRPKLFIPATAPLKLLWCSRRNITGQVMEGNDFFNM